MQKSYKWVHVCPFSLVLRHVGLGFWKTHLIHPIDDFFGMYWECISAQFSYMALEICGYFSA